MKPEFSLSVAVPVHNEERNIPKLLKRIGGVLDGLAGGPHQILIVDDGSWDRSSELLKAAAEKDPRITVIVLSRNFGHQAALSAALDHITGDAVVLMDGDLQTLRRLSRASWKSWNKAMTLCMQRGASRKEGLGLRLCYYLFYRLQAALSDISLPIDAGDFGLMSRRVVEQVRKMREHHRYLRGPPKLGWIQADWRSHRAGGAGGGKEQIWLFCLLKLAFDAIFAFSVWPLRAATLVGAAAAGLSGIFAVYSIYAKFVMHKFSTIYRSGIVDILSLRGPAFFPGHYWGVPWKGLRGIKGASYLRHRRDYSSCRASPTKLAASVKSKLMDAVARLSVSRS